MKQKENETKWMLLDGVAGCRPKSTFPKYLFVVFVLLHFKSTIDRQNNIYFCLLSVHASVKRAMEQTNKQINKLTNNHFSLLQL